MLDARKRFAAVIAAALLTVAACSSTPPDPTVSAPPAPPAPTALPGNWSEQAVQVPGDAGAATYLAPRNPQRLRAALILVEPGKAGELAGKELALMLANLGVASLRFDGAPSTALNYNEALDRAGRGLTALADTSKLADDRLLAVGHGSATTLALALGVGLTGRGPVPVGLIEPVLTDGPAGAPDPVRVAVRLPGQRHNIVTCSDADVAVDCTAVQELADAMTGTHVNYVQLRGVSHSLQEDASRDPARYGPPTPYSAELHRSLGSWVAMQ